MMMFFWVLTPCRPVGKYQRLALKMETVCSSETLSCTYQCTRGQTQKNVIILNAARNSDLTNSAYRFLRKESIPKRYVVADKLNVIMVLV
jgi:hypothetical protein